MRRRRWLGALGVGLLVGGGLLALLDYPHDDDARAVVRGYFAALARSDAPAALSYGTLPAGPHALLTSAVLRAQNHLAPLRAVRVGALQRHGSRATVAVTYTVAYPGSAQHVSARVGLHEHGGEWRLDAVAVPTQLQVPVAQQRATVVGGQVPAGGTLLFPGIVPVSFDTPYLALDPTQDVLGFGAGGTTPVVVQVSATGRRAAYAAVAAALRGCLTGHGPVGCPLPDERYVPGSIRGTLAGAVSDKLSVILDDSQAGELDISGVQPVQASSYQLLDFSNRRVSGRGGLSLQVSARAYAVAPLTIRWVTG